MVDYYGAKCHRCAHIDHRGEQSAALLPWLDLRGLECADCTFCQSAAFSRAVESLDLDIFDPEVRAATKAVLNGKHHPLIDTVQAEILQYSLDKRFRSV